MHIVLVRAFRGEPLRRTVIECGARVIYLSHPDKVAAVRAGDSFPVGFPLDDVFEFAPQLYDRLRSQWDRDGRTDQAIWSEASPFQGFGILSGEAEPSRTVPRLTRPNHV